METKTALNIFYGKLTAKSLHTTGKLPICSYKEEGKFLYKSEPDENGNVEWSSSPIEDFSIKQLTLELDEFFCSFYHAEFCGRIKKYHFQFRPIYTIEEVKEYASDAYMKGMEMFPQEDIHILAKAKTDSDDDLLLCYNETDENLFVYNPYTDERNSLRLSLPGFFYKLEPLE